MSDPVANWVEKLAAKPLPALQEGIQQVKLMLDSPSVNHIRLSNFIEFDPGFCVHVFRAMNRLPKRPKETITKLSNALPMLGMERMTRATRELKAAETVLKKKPLTGLIDCFSRAAHAAIYAQILAQQRGAETLSEYAVAALLHDIGEMTFWVQHPDLIETVNQRTVRGESRDQVAREILGCTIEQISDGISRAWELPALTIEAQDLSNSYREAPLIVMLAAALARSTARGWNTQATRDQIELLGEFLDMGGAAANGYFHTLAAEAARRLTGRGFVLPAFGLIQQRPVSLTQAGTPQPKVAQRAGTPAAQVRGAPAPPLKPERRPDPVLHKAETEAPQRPVPPPRPRVPNPAKQATKPGVESRPEKPPASGSLAEPRVIALESMRNEQPMPGPVGDPPEPPIQPTARARASAPRMQPEPVPREPRNTIAERPAAEVKRSSTLETIAGTLREMLGQQQLRRLMFAVLTRDRKGLKCGLAMDVPSRPSLKGFALGFERANLFSALLKKPQIFWLNQENKTKYLPTVPSETRDLLCEEGFLLMSVFVKNRPVGIVYADSGNRDIPLTPESYNIFKNACQRLVKTLNGQL